MEILVVKEEINDKGIVRKKYYTIQTRSQEMMGNGFDGVWMKMNTLGDVERHCSCFNAILLENLVQAKSRWGYFSLKI